MVLKKLLHHPFIERLRRLPKRAYLLAGLCFVILIYIALFIIPRSVTFSYASEQTCINNLTLFPSLQQSVGSATFRVETNSVIKLGNFPLLSTKNCIVPTATPKQGSHYTGVAPFGAWLFRQNMTVVVGAAPTPNLDNLQRPVPAMKPLKIPLSNPDMVNSYSLRVGSRIAPCTSTNAAISCDMVSLGLGQGKSYTATLMRAFKDMPATKLAQVTLTTLTATTITDGSVKTSDTIYARPQEFMFTTDKSLKHAKVTVTKADGSLVSGVTVRVADKVITVKLAKELDRESDYVLTIASVEATDGSGLVEPYTVNFHMSGGPKVVAVSIGKTGVSGTAQVVVTFDQELSPAQDISKIVTFTGGAATIARSGNQIIYRLQSLPICTPFTLSITKGVLSKYDIASTSGWSYASRVVCHTTSTYGYSIKGRSLQAYSFGTDGPITMYVGAIHGNESSSSGLMKSWVDYLEVNPSLYDGKRVVIVPTINPDGVASNTRTNARGVNLNRNFPTDSWVSDINDTDGSHPGGGGVSPLSEPEASALATLTTSLHPRLLLSFHAIGSLVTGDAGGYSAGYATKYASLVGYRDATGQADTFDYDITGAYEDWTYAKQGIPSIVVELGSYGYYDFSYHRAALQAMLQ